MAQGLAAETPRPYVTVFGGEPLRHSPAHHHRINAVLRGARERGLEVAVVTNGYDLEAFLPALARGPVKEVSRSRSTARGSSTTAAVRTRAGAARSTGSCPGSTA